MALIDLKNVRLSYGGPVLLKGVDLAIEPGERVCLLGRNGEGKSSLIKIMSGDLLPDQGEITRAQGLRQGVLEQEVPGAMAGTVFDVVAGGIGGLGRLVAEYHALAAGMEADNDPNLTRSLGEIQHRLEVQGGWQLDRNVTSVISRLADPALYREGGAGVVQAKARLETIKQELPRLYARWEELEEMMQPKGPAASLP
jgi:ATP-binding cassette subfamily F protein uup